MCKYSHECSICGEKFSDNKMSNVTIKLKKHLIKEHNLSYEKYIIDTFHSGKTPTCLCGCGSELRFIPKNSLFGEGHGFTKYVHCGHVGRGKKWQSDKVKLKWEDKDWVLNHYETSYGIKNLQKMFVDFMSGKSALEISKENDIDVRTLKFAWVKLCFITAEELTKISKDRKRYAGAEKRRIKFENCEEICKDLYDLIKCNPQKYNIRSLIKFYNSFNAKKIETDPDIVLRNLIEIFGDGVNDYLQFGKHSKEELDLLNVLKFYFKKYKIMCGKKIYYGNVNKKQYYIYDFCIGNKIIIEYDGNGYFHKDKNIIKKDKEKELLAIKKNYVFIRLSYEESKNINFLLKLKNILENDRIC